MFFKSALLYLSLLSSSASAQWGNNPCDPNDPDNYQVGYREDFTYPADYKDSCPEGYTIHSVCLSMATSHYLDELYLCTHCPSVGFSFKVS